MIQVKEKFTIIADEGMKSAKFSIHDSNLAKVFGILRSNLYSDKILAVIREYSTNAYDANVDNGKPLEPIHVTLPTMFDPIFKVRDFGKGLTEDDIFHIYSSYGASTKENTNDQVGMLGMGSKSGFAYANSFTVVSYNGGMKTSYEAYIDETDLGVIAKVHSEPTTEPTGIEVIIAVDSKDIQAFYKTANTFYRFFTPTPVIHNKPSRWTSIDDEYTVIQKKDNYTLYNTRASNYYNECMSGIAVKMGNIVYPVDTSFLKQKDIAAHLDRRYLLVINAKIGEITFTASREKLEYSPITQASVNKYFSEVIELARKEVEATINNAPSAYKAIIEFLKLDGLSRTLSGGTCDYKGKSLSPTLSTPADFRWFQGQRGKWFKQHHNFSDKNIYILRDAGVPVWAVKPRLKAAYDQYKSTKNIYFYDSTIEEADALKAMPEMQGAEIAYLSQYGGVISNKGSKGVHSQSLTVFKWNGSSRFPYSSCWESVETKAIPHSQKVYVDIYKFMPKDTNLSMSVIADIVNTFKQITGKTITLYGCKTPRKGKDWVSLTTYIQKEMLKVTATKDWEHYITWSGHSNPSRFVANFMTTISQLTSVTDPTLKWWVDNKDALDKWNSLLNYSQVQVLFRLLNRSWTNVSVHNIKFDNEVVNNKLKELYEKFPMIKHYPDYTYNKSDIKQADWIEYLSMAQAWKSRQGKP